MKANKPETVEEILVTLENEVATDMHKRLRLHITGKSPNQSHAEAKQSLRQLLLAGVPEEEPEGANEFERGDTAGFNACRKLWIDYINKITE